MYLRLERAGGQRLADPRGGVRLRQIHRQHQRLRPAGGGDLGRQFVQPLLAARHQHQIVAMPGKHPRQLARRCRPTRR